MCFSVVRHAKLATDLTRDRLCEDFDQEDGHVRGHGISVDRNYLLLGGLRGMPIEGFILGGGLDLDTGDLYVGGVQKEASVAEIVGGFWIDGQFLSSMEVCSSGIEKAPFAFELERLFPGGILPLSVVSMYADGHLMNELDVETQNAELQIWCEQYARAVRNSLFGKPMAEADYAKRQYGRFARPLSPELMSLLYGPVLASALARLRESDLQKYL